jgi:hypothetical protein
MNEKNLISYNIFCRRKKFSLESYIKINPNIEYHQIRSFFIEKKVIPPTEELFLEVKKNIVSKESLVTETLVKKETKKTITDLPKKTRKPTRKRKKEK